MSDRKNRTDSGRGTQETNHDCHILRHRAPADGAIDLAAIRMRYEALAPNLDERALRLSAASEALVAGRGGIAAVSLVAGIACSTIGRGPRELRDHAAALPQGRIRRSGGGRKAAI